MAAKSKLETGLGKLAFVVAVMAAVTPPASQADQVILDDLIVTQSACVGFDCENDQPFGFTTFMMRENNLRIFLDDTSTISAFPRNDWEIVANDTVDGGESFLGFADRGMGLVSVSGEGTCEGGADHGLACGGPGEGNCFGICAGGLFDGQPCPPDPGICSENGGICVDAGVCVPDGAIIFRIEAGGPEDSLVIDSAGDVFIAGDLTVGGTVNGNSEAIQELQEEVEALRAEIEAIKSFPALLNWLERQ